MDKNEIEKAIIKETPEEFSNRVEEYVWAHDVSYYEAVSALMEKSEYEPEQVAKMLTAAIKTQLEKEVKTLNLVRKTKKK